MLTTAALAQDVPRSVLAGCSARLRGHHWFVGCHASRWSLLFWKHRTAWCRHLEVGHRVRVRLHPCRSAGRVSRSWIRAIRALGGHRFLACRNSLSSIFHYSHHGNSGEDWIGLFNVGAFGLLACFLLRRTGNLWMPIGLHAAFDWGETYFYGVANSGHVLPGHLLNSSSSGPAWLSGGTVGPEGSVLHTVLIIVVWLICAGWLREAKYPNFTRVGHSNAGV